MAELETSLCPECTDPEAVDRRDFMRAVTGGTAALLTGAAITPAISAQHRVPLGPRPAEALCRELWATMTNDQKRQYAYAWDHANRLRTFNAAMNGRLSQVYTRPQQELIERIMRAISSGDEGFNKLARNGGWDTNGGFGGCGANFFGDPTSNQWSWVFSCHHLTVRCDGNSEPDYAFGGPMYYGHGPVEGNSQRNVFYAQTRAAQSVFEALNADQRRRALMTASGWMESPPRFRRDGFPGIRSSDLSADQRRLVESVMRELLSPYRREDADEVMDIIRQNGGMERLHLGFFRQGTAENAPWNVWRIEGPGFVWNFRILPHVHCYVNVAVRA